MEMRCLENLRTPCYVIDTDILTENFKTVKARADQAGLSLLMAMKGFPLAKALRLVAPFVDGISASGLFEAKLGQCLRKEVHVHTPAYKKEDVPEILDLCDHIVLNAPGQFSLFAGAATGKNEFALRLNPEFGAVRDDIYNPCGKYSRFGVRQDELKAVGSGILDKISGFHVHALCGNSSEDFDGLIAAVVAKFSGYLGAVSWINLGGGMALTEDGFDFDRFREGLDVLHSRYHLKTYIEPCEYLVIDSGFLVVTVLDIVHNGKDIVILDTSVSCHALDVLKNYYRLPVVFPEQAPPGAKKTYSYILAGNSCLSGDIFGEYGFSAPLKAGDRIVFGDMGSYSFAQQNYFNGINFPDVAFYSKSDGITRVKDFSYRDYERVYD